MVSHCCVSLCAWLWVRPADKDKDKEFFQTRKTVPIPARMRAKWPVCVCTGLQEHIFKTKKKICAASLSPVERQGDQAGMPGHEEFCNTCPFLNPLVAWDVTRCFAVVK